MAVSRIRIRQTLDKSWAWELVTADGHVAAASEPFGDRASCEADAKAQADGLPVVGLVREERKRGAKLAAAKRPGLEVSCDASGVWHWSVRDAAGELLSAAECGFLSKEECVANARKSGHVVAAGSPDESE